MSSKYVHANKNYGDSCFILTDSKFIRIIEVIKERMDRAKNNHTYHETYTISFKNDKELILNSLDDTLKLDNSQKNPIVKIESSIKLEIDNKISHNIEIHFDSQSYRGKNLSASGSAQDGNWLQETMGAVEEQMERTIPNEIAYSINKSPQIAIFFLGVLLIVLSNLLAPSKNSFAKFNDATKSSLIELKKQTDTSEEKIDFIYSYLSATLDENEQSKKIDALFKNPKTFLIGIPGLIFIASIFIAIYWFYPRNIFAWGDCGENFKNTIERRRFIWYGVVFSLAIGVLGNLFVIGAVSG